MNSTMRLAWSRSSMRWRSSGARDMAGTAVLRVGRIGYSPRRRAALTGIIDTRPGRAFCGSRYSGECGKPPQPWFPCHHPPMPRNSRDSGASPLPAIPRHPHAWAWVVLLPHAAVALAWWQLGWRWGLPLLLVLHLGFVWGTLRPGSRLFGPVATRFDTAAPEVWLTIDDGPSPDTAAILDLLDAHGAKATFFLVGERARARPDLVRDIAVRGHGIGNHSHTHPQARFWALGPGAMRREILDCQQALS